ncbi:MAG: hypothetical protein ABR936_16865 [Bacteroidota bacterium]|jgi:hypothetical protein
MKNPLLYLIITLLFFCSCSDPFKNKYAGKWIEAKREVDIINIDKNNEDYIVTYEGKRLPAIYKDRNLEVTIGGLKPTMMLDENTDRILFLEKEYIRIENSFTARFCGMWSYGSDSKQVIKILKDEYGRFKFQCGYQNEGKITWEESMNASGYQSDVYLSLVNDNLVGEYYFLAPHSILLLQKINIRFKSKDKLLYSDNDQVNEATKQSD